MIRLLLAAAGRLSKFFIKALPLPAMTVSSSQKLGGGRFSLTTCLLPANTELNLE